VGIEQLLHRRMHTAVFGGVVVDGAGHADGRGSRDEHQSDHRYCEGQFHGTPLKMQDGKQAVHGGKRYVRLG
jgi:hypothetical protein